MPRRSSTGPSSTPLTMPIPSTPPGLFHPHPRHHHASRKPRRIALFAPDCIVGHDDLIARPHRHRPHGRRLDDSIPAPCRSPCRHPHRHPRYRRRSSGTQHPLHAQRPATPMLPPPPLIPASRTPSTSRSVAKPATGQPPGNHRPHPFHATLAPHSARPCPIAAADDLPALPGASPANRHCLHAQPPAMALPTPRTMFYMATGRRGGKRDRREEPRQNTRHGSPGVARKEKRPGYQPDLFS